MRDLCYKIKDILVENNFKVWMDVDDADYDEEYDDDTGGLSLDTITQALVDSKYVLICMTEKYRQSIKCRIEAEYAYQLKKPIIPLIMQYVSTT